MPLNTGYKFNMSEGIPTYKVISIISKPFQLLIGDRGVGKTAFLNRHLNGQFKKEYTGLKISKSKFSSYIGCGCSASNIPNKPWPNSYQCMGHKWRVLRPSRSLSARFTLTFDTSTHRPVLYHDVRYYITKFLQEYT